MRGLVEAQLRVDDKSIHEKVYITDNQNTNLFSKHACGSLGLIRCNTKYVHNVNVIDDKSLQFYYGFSDIFQV